MTKQEFNNLPLDKKVETLNKIFKGEIELKDKNEVEELFGNLNKK